MADKEKTEPTEGMPEEQSEAPEEAAADAPEKASAKSKGEEKKKPARRAARKSDDADEDAEDEDEEAASDSDSEGEDASAKGDGSHDDAEGGAAAKRVANALGVGDEADAEAEAAATAGNEPEVAPNRAARRREEAQRRRKKKASAAPSAPATADDVDEELPKDKNKRAKELLARRREQASSGGRRPVQLLPGEMVDDALARSASATSKWVKTNFSKLQWLALAAVLGTAGFLGWRYLSDKKTAAASDVFADAIAADRGRVLAEDNRTEEKKSVDFTRYFKTTDEHEKATLAGYEKVVSEYPNTAQAILAKLGEAGVMLDKRDYDHALETYGSVRSSKLGTADADVKGRSIEGIGLAKEGKGDLDGALAAFKELESIDARGFKELGMFHQARIAFGKGDKETAKDLFKKLFDTLKVPTGEGHPYPYLEASVTEFLRQIDPTLAPAKMPMGGSRGNALSAEEYIKERKKSLEAAEKRERH